MTNCVPDLNILDSGAQCFPLYYYVQRTGKAPQLPGVSQGDAEYERKDAITDFALKECRERYGQQVTKEDIFYFIYGFLHSPDYRTTFANDLKKSLPRIPFLDSAEDFWAFSKAGRELADLHLNYEEQPAHPDVKIQMRRAEGVDETGLYRVVKMRFPDKANKSVIRYNDRITLSNIPLDAYDYVVNGRSAIGWIMERYQVKTDSASGIVNDPNDWSAEHGKPRYILDLLLSVITVSLKTQEIVNGLPKLSFGDK